MKRRYKPGDWFRVPLGAGRAAVGIIAFADRSRLAGYFFGLRGDPTHAALRSLRTEHALLAVHFGGAPIEDRRWPLIATSLHFDESRWPRPRGVNGFATAEQVEAMLLRAMTGECAQPPAHVRELRSPVEPRSLRDVPPGTRLQLREPMTQTDLQLLAQLFAARPDLALRVHGAWPGGFDLREIDALSMVRALSLDVPVLYGSERLSSYRELRSLHIGTHAPAPLRGLYTLEHLRRLSLNGPGADVGVLRRLQGLEELELRATLPVPLDAVACAASLRTLRLAHGAYSLDGVRALENLEKLELRELFLERLADLSGNPNLRSVALRNLRGLRDLVPLKTAPLESLTIEGMPQLEIGDFAALVPWEPLPALSIEIGSRSIRREAYRMLAPALTAGRTQ